MTDFVTVEGRELHRAMKIASDLIETRNAIPVLGCVMLTYDKTGLKIDATDLDMWVTLPVDEIEGGGKWSICVESAILANIAKVAGVMPMRIECVDLSVPSKGNRDKEIRTVHTLQVTLGDGEVAYTVDNTIPATDYPTYTKERGKLIERFTNGMLASTLAKVAWAISNEETRYYLNGVCWQIGGTGRRFVATDGHRLALCRYSSEAELADFQSLIIPRRSVAFIQKHLPNADVSIYAVSDASGIQIQAPGIVFRTKLIDGTFPDIDRVIPKDSNIAFVFNLRRDEMFTAITQATAINTGKHSGRAVRLSGENGKLNIEMKNGGAGTGKVKTSADWPQDLLPFGFNNRYALEILGSCQGNVKFGIEAASSPITITDADETMTRVLMPMGV